MIYHSKGEIDLAITDFTKAIELYPKFAEVYVRRGIELNPKLEEVYVSRGMAYTKKGEFERAIVDYAEAIALKPDDADAYYRRSKVWLHLGQPEKAKADMQTASKIGINSSTALDETLQNYDRAWKALGNL